MVSDAEREQRFRQLYAEHYHRVLGYARRRCPHDDASDVAAETFTVAWRRFERVPEGDEALYWLYATARRVLANHRRSTQRRADLIGVLRAGASATAAAPPTVETNRVAAALRHLRDEDVELLLLVAWEGLDAEAIAKVAGCSRNAARIRLHRARRRFARALDAADGDVKRDAASGHVVAATLGLEERR